MFKVRNVNFSTNYFSLDISFLNAFWISFNTIFHNNQPTYFFLHKHIYLTYVISYYLSIKRGGGEVNAMLNQENLELISVEA